MENMIFSDRMYLGRKQIVLDCKFVIEPNREVESVLSIQSKPIVFTTRCEDGKVTFGGKLDTTFIFESTNQEKICLVNVSEFLQSYENSAIESGDEAMVECKVVDITTPSIKTNEVKVACIVDVGISLVKNKSEEIGYSHEDFIVKPSTITTLNWVQAINGNFDINEEVKVEDSVSKVLKVDANSSIVDAYCGKGFISLDIKTMLSIIYIDDFGSLKVHKANLQVRQEVECEKSTIECSPNISIEALNYLTKTIVTQGDGYNIVKVQTPIQYFGSIYQKEDKEIVVDAYSATQIINTENEDLIALKDCKNLYYESSAHGTVDIDCDNIVLVGALNASCEVTNCELIENKLVVDGIASVCVLYKKEQNNASEIIEQEKVEEKEENTQERKEELVPVRVDFGFSFSIDAEKLSECNSFMCFGNVCDLDVDLSNSQINIIANIALWVSGFSTQKYSFIKDIKVLKQRETKTCAMEIFVSEKEQGLWDLCKQIGLDKGEVLKQNPTLKEVVNKGEKIFIYYKVQSN